MSVRYFEYLGEPYLTRGQYGYGVRGGHTTEDDLKYISVFDPDYGDRIVISIDAGLESGDWVEISRAEWASL